MKMRKNRDSIHLLVPAFILMSLVFAVVLREFSVNAAAISDSSEIAETENLESGTHFISIFDDGVRTNVRSDASTVREAIIRANLTLDDGDKIEPALDEQINSNDFNINIFRARDVLVLDGNKRIHVKTASTNPADIVTDSGATLLDADTVKIVPYNNLLETGDTVAYKIIRAKVVHLNFYGKKVDVRTQAKTVADFAKERSIDVDKTKNWISVPLEERIADGIAISIQPQGRQTITVEEAIPFGETVTYDYDLEHGKREVIKHGENGTKTVTYEVEMYDGIEKSRQFVDEIVTKNAVTQEVRVGMKVVLPAGSHNDWMAQAGIPADQYGYVNFIIEHESHWNPLSRNTKSGATGLCQALPGNKMASAGSDWATNPITQLRWCNGYAAGRYGSWQKAYEFWQKHHWW